MNVITLASIKSVILVKHNTNGVNENALSGKLGLLIENLVVT